MLSFERTGAVLASTVLRLVAFVFLRWIPGHPFPPIVYSTFVIYVISFSACALTSSRKEEPKIPQRTKAERSGRLKNVSNGHVCFPGPSRVQEKKENDPDIFRSLVTGLPSPNSIVCSIATFSINTVLVLMVISCVYAPNFIYPSYDLSIARVGYLSENSAKIFIREPDPLQLPITLTYRHADDLAHHGLGQEGSDTAWKTVATIRSLKDATDFTVTITIPRLKPDTRYQYVLSNKHNGFFITPPPVGKTSQRNNGKFAFLHTSCIIPNFPYDPLAHPLSIHGFRHLSKWLSNLKPAFMLFLGDFIYADVPARHGSDVASYRKHYRQVYASPDWISVTKTSKNANFDGADYDIPWLHTYDDHEIANDWSQNTTGYFRAAFDPYLHYHLGPNPPLPVSSASHPRDDLVDISPSDFALTNHPPTYTSFTQGPATFFFLDTRRYRQPPSPQKNTSMLGPAQLDALLTWLDAPTPAGVHWKILVSSVPFTRNWRVNAHDTWSGYTTERRAILEAMWQYGSSARVGSEEAGIVILSGDRHEFAATAFPPPTDAVAEGRWSASATVHEFSTSPLSQFYLPVRTYKQDAAGSLMVKILEPSEAGHDSQSSGHNRGGGQEEDVCLKYIPEGNSKFGVLEIEPPTGSGVSLLRYRLFVEGVEVWSHVLSVGGPDAGTTSAVGNAGRKIKEMWKEGIWE